MVDSNIACSRIVCSRVRVRWRERERGRERNRDSERERQRMREKEREREEERERAARSNDVDNVDWACDDSRMRFLKKEESRGI